MKTNREEGSKKENLNSPDPSVSVKQREEDSESRETYWSQQSVTDLGEEQVTRQQVGAGAGGDGQVETLWG